MKLDDVKEVIFRTECKKYIFEGLSCSEPIMTQKDGKVVDNFFIYSHDEQYKKVSEPIIEFGIFADEERTAYIRQMNNELECRVLDESDFDTEKAAKAYDEYVCVYPIVRECAYMKEITFEQARCLRRYLICLRVLSGKVLWEIYLNLYSDFFEWAHNKLEDSKEA